MKKNGCFFLVIILLISIFAGTTIQVGSSQTPALLDPNTIPKWVNQLAQAPPIYTANNVTDSSGKLVSQEYVVKIKEFQQQLLPTADSTGNPTAFPSSTVWGFEGEAKDAVTGESLGLVHSTPGCSFEAVRGVPVQVKWINDLVDSSGNPLPNLFAVDPTLMWANPNAIQMPNPSSVLPGGYSQAQSPVPISMHLH